VSLAFVYTRTMGMSVPSLHRGLYTDSLIFRASPSSGGDDYFSVSGEFIFSSGSTEGDSECVNVDIVNDEALEVTEVFTFALFCYDSAVDLLAPVADVYIEDKDG